MTPFCKSKFLFRGPSDPLQVGKERRGQNNQISDASLCIHLFSFAAIQKSTCWFITELSVGFLKCVVMEINMHTRPRSNTHFSHT